VKYQPSNLVLNLVKTVKSCFKFNENKGRISCYTTAGGGEPNSLCSALHLQLLCSSLCGPPTKMFGDPSSRRFHDCGNR